MDQVYRILVEMTVLEKQWERRSADFRAAGLSDAAGQLDTLRGELLARLEPALEETCSNAIAAAIVGRDERTIHRWLKDGRLANLGHYGAPRIRIGEVVSVATSRSLATR